MRGPPVFALKKSTNFQIVYYWVLLTTFSSIKVKSIFLQCDWRLANRTAQAHTGVETKCSQNKEDIDILFYMAIKSVFKLASFLQGKLSF